MSLLTDSPRKRNSLPDRAQKKVRFEGESSRRREKSAANPEDSRRLSSEKPAAARMRPALVGRDRADLLLSDDQHGLAHERMSQHFL
jgi:hypothetical protein